MRKYDKLVQQSFLNDEQAIIKRLKQVYAQSLKDINAKIAQLMSRSDADMSHVIYQVEYQKALKKQIENILNDLHTGQFSTISEYLVHCYDNGFMGAMYALQQQGIPLCIPIDQTQVVRAVQLDSKISNGLYSRLGEDVAELKKKITAQVSRGISTGMTYAQVAQQLAAYTNIGFNNAVRITRTEGHRIQVQSAMDAAEQAKEHGAEVVKQWDSTLDRRTRPAHKKVDGEIREIDEKFSNGLMFPGDPHGKASEVINCRCALLQRAKWALDDEELETLKKRAEYFELDKSKDFEDFKKKYRKAATKIKAQESKAKFVAARTREEAANFAKTAFNVDADYAKYNIDVANAVNETMYKVRDVFGDAAFNKLNRIGTFPKGYSTRWQGVYVSSQNPDVDGSLWLRNVGTKKSLEKLETSAKEQFEAGWWSTPEALHTIRHELGHAIHYAIGTDEKNAAINSLRKSIQDERLRRNRSGDRNHKYADWLSEYGMTNTKEFVAESIAEYLVGNPRETAAKVVQILIGGK